MSNLIRSPWLRMVFLTLGIAAGLTLAAAMRKSYPPQPPKAPATAPLREAAWAKVRPHLDQADKESADGVEEGLKPVRAFFSRHASPAAGPRAFAEEVLSLWGKWVFLQSSLPFADPQAHERFLRESFERHLFKAEELDSLVKSVISSYVSEAEGRDNQLLVAIQTDLGDSAFAQANLLPEIRGEEQFRREFHRMAEELMPALGSDLGMTVGAFIGSEIAGQIATRVLFAAATQMGVSGGILGTGAVSSVATFGVGLVVSIIVDQVIQWAMAQAGYDPVGEIEAKMQALLRGMEESIVSGSPSQIQRYRELRQEESQAGNGPAREAAKAKAEEISKSGELGLQFELQRLHELRSQIRRVTLEKMFLKGGA